MNFSSNLEVKCATATLRTREPSCAVNLVFLSGLRDGRVNNLNCSSETISTRCDPTDDGALALPLATSYGPGIG